MSNEIVISEESQITLARICNEIAKTEDQIAELKKAKENNDKLKKELKEYMEEYGIKSWETPSKIKITLVETKPDETYEKTIFDEARFQEENKELFNEYISKHNEYKTTVTMTEKGKAGYVRITMPKKKEESEINVEEIPF